MLWDIIRDWFVVNIWGGINSIGDFYYGVVGQAADHNGPNYQTMDTSTFYLPINAFNSEEPEFLITYISIGDWLSTTSTIIVMILLCIIFGLMVRWLFRLTSGLIQGRG